jgi:ABC-type polysaccharide/polyol phosphate export permease
MQKSRGMILKPLLSSKLWIKLGIWDIKQKYRLSALGPLWIIGTTSITIIALSYIWSNVYGKNLTSMIPYFSVGYILWLFITSTLNEAASSLISAEHYLRNTDIFYSEFVYRVVFRNIIIAGHNSLILIPLMLLFPSQFSNDWVMLVIVLPVGLLLAVIAITGIALNVALMGLRFRDVIPLVANLLNLMFFVTPILWEIDESNAKQYILYEWNPVYWILQLIRFPLLNGSHPGSTYLLYLIGLIFVLFFMANYFYKKYKNLIPMWI